jgi:hypothetical protein
VTVSLALTDIAELESTTSTGQSKTQTKKNRHRWSGKGKQKKGHPNTTINPDQGPTLKACLLRIPSQHEWLQLPDFSEYAGPGDKVYTKDEADVRVVYSLDEAKDINTRRNVWLIQRLAKELLSKPGHSMSLGDAGEK